jgi:hypothetical protein
MPNLKISNPANPQILRILIQTKYPENPDSNNRQPPYRLKYKFRSEYTLIK